MDGGRAGPCTGGFCTGGRGPGPGRGGGGFTPGIQPGLGLGLGRDGGGPPGLGRLFPGPPPGLEPTGLDGWGRFPGAGRLPGFCPPGFCPPGCGLPCWPPGRPFGGGVWFCEIAGNGAIKQQKTRGRNIRPSKRCISISRRISLPRQLTLPANQKQSGSRRGLNENTARARNQSKLLRQLRLPFAYKVGSSCDGRSLRITPLHRR